MKLAFLTLLPTLFFCAPAFADTAPISAVDAPAAEAAPVAEAPATTEQHEPDYKHFESWLEEFRIEAAAKGISEAVLEDALGDLDEPVEEIIERDKSQPEHKSTFKQYVTGVITKKKIAAARAAWKENKKILIDIENTYDVPASVMLALWGIESNFGKNQGSHPLVDSLATLAYDARRSAFFRAQLIDALKILQQEKMKSAEFLGSWAGAMGQVQFMPSSFLRYAVDYNKDGKRDIWENNGDAIASMANYLHDKGWDRNADWGVPVSLPTDTTMDWATMKERLPVSNWKKFGVRQKNGKMLKGVSEEARLVLLDGDQEQAYLVYPNFDVLMDWNRSTYFATTVNMLADAIEDSQ